jgi:hypothetical protein
MFGDRFLETRIYSHQILIVDAVDFLRNVWLFILLNFLKK